MQYLQGPVVEEDHYYPFGLTMAALSDKAIKTNYAENKFRYNSGSELQNKEFNDGSGLEMYEMAYRGLDPQLGRFTAIDPLANGTPYLSPYLFAGDKPESSTDPSGAKQKLKDVNGDGPPGQGQGGGGDEFNGAAYNNPNYWNLGDGGGGGSGGYGDGGDAGDDGGGESYSAATYYHYWSTLISYLMGQPSGTSWDASAELTGSGLDVSDQAIAADNDPVISASNGGGDEDRLASEGDSYGQIYQISDQIVNGQIFRGAIFAETVDISSLKFSSFQWIQDVNVDPEFVHDGNGIPNPVIDGTYDDNGCQTNWPFYYGQNESTLNGHFALFSDNPGTPSANYSFSASTTLIGLNSTGYPTMTAIATFNWGYQVNNNITSLLPLSTSGPSATTSNIIHSINALTLYNTFSHY